MLKGRTWAFLGLAAGLLVAALLVACGDDDNGNGDGQATEPAETTDAGETEEPDGGPSSELGLIAENLLWDKTELRAPADTPLAITVDNRDGGVPHNLYIFETEQDYIDQAEPLASTEDFNGPDVRTLDVPALEAGEYFYICTIHPTTMTGTLIVE